MQIVLFLLSLISAQAVPFHSLSVNDINGNQINFSSFVGKKVLLVNTASNSTHVQQYSRLEQLYQLHKDSLVIIAIPANDFGHEPRNDSSIASFVYSNYQVNYLLGAKLFVKGNQQSSLYNWISKIQLNGMMNGSVGNDFYKFLVNGEGKLIGMFTEEVDPLDDELQDAIRY